MTQKQILLAFLSGLMILLQACSGSRRVSAPIVPDPYPKAAREFRAAWVATVANINWPSKPGLPSEDQKREALELLDFLAAHHFNAVVFQVRPQCDALYKSELEPWSYFLSGQQGQPPNPYYDPLEFWIEAAHDRGLELHVWLNPYRAHHKAGMEISDQSIVKKHPELVVYLKEGYWWMDPSLKATRDHSTAVVMDLVKRYDIDGVHFDDYFYPYPSYNGGADFPDSASWTNYRSGGGKLTKGNWRRESVNILIKELYQKIKSARPHVKFGLSPFGIWRPGFPESVEGFDQYDQLYADARLWLNNGWIDYFAPQLYWPVNVMQRSFPVLLGWWATENKHKRHLWPGISVGRDTSQANVKEIISQIMISRGMLPQSNGIVHWSISSLTLNPNMARAILEGPYRNNALVPVSKWLDNTPPLPPQISTSAITATTPAEEKIKVEWDHPDPKDVFRWVVYFKYQNQGWKYLIMNRNEKTLELDRYALNRAQVYFPIQKLAVVAVDRLGNESKMKIIDIGRL